MKKIILKDLHNRLNRDEMRKILAGSGPSCGHCLSMLGMPCSSVDGTSPVCACIFNGNLGCS